MKRTVLVTAALLALCAGSALATPVPAHRARRHARPALHATVSADSALAIARAQVPGGTVKSHELEREMGKLIYSFDFVVPGKTGIDEVNIDAMTGNVLAVKHETPKAERKEKRQEQREAASKSGH